MQKRRLFPFQMSRVTYMTEFNRHLSHANAIHWQNPGTLTKKFKYYKDFLPLYQQGTVSTGTILSMTHFTPYTPVGQTNLRWAGPSSSPFIFTSKAKSAAHTLMNSGPNILEWCLL